jgi:hypothetical protein
MDYRNILKPFHGTFLAIETKQINAVLGLFASKKPFARGAIEILLYLWERRLSPAKD